MRNRIVVALLGLLGLMTLGGCPHYAIVRATQSGQIYIVSHQMGRSDVVYSCDAPNDKPICYPTQEGQQ
jgi:hypothetical protein